MLESRGEFPFAEPGQAMITVVSRFRVRNDMEEEVRRAFDHRPGLVEAAEGFRGLEVHRDADDPSIFYLVTRWRRREDFEAWHGSDAHRQSHEGIPGGLKLDPDYTRVTVMDRFHPDGPGDGASWIHRAEQALADFAATNPDVHVLLLDRQGRVRHASAAAGSWLGRDPEELRGRSILELLVEHDKPIVQEALEAEVGTSRTLSLSFVDEEQRPYAVVARVRVEPGQVVLAASPEARNLRDLQTRLVELNNELSLVARESERRRRKLERTKTELEGTLTELDESYWHLKKIQEVLPICMSCGRVKTGEAQWQDVVEYLKDNSLFLSHGFCPDCYDVEATELEDDAIGETLA